MADHDAPLIRSVDRAVTLLYLLADGGPMRVTDLARTVGIHKSTASRLLSTLQARGLADQDPGSGTYRLGHGVVRLAGAVDHGFDLGSVSRPVCTRLAQETGETVNVVILDDGRTMCIDQVIGSASVTTINWVGKRSPVHATASGKAFLAHVPPEERRVLLSRRLDSLTPSTITDVDVLETDLARVRERGWAASVDEQEDGLTSVAAPVLGPDGNVVAALALSGPSFRLAGERLAAIGAATAAAADQISHRTGHVRTELADQPVSATTDVSRTGDAAS
ncbi:IclR family transcriptional regulator [Salsipaludibacter albus]|uniref:IclR family transcriptional regulator n=1 Tax=Salsipaludibacter albus TaxID=2849650 RepID=UPI001EE3FD8A|nr:IclR family transcriptional regulator [Salsipaludibacter albus]MBY5162378.1 IclR family transcriptional regulator [Salsipaludibacter albus]